MLTSLTKINFGSGALLDTNPDVDVWQYSRFNFLLCAVALVQPRFENIPSIMRYVVFGSGPLTVLGGVEVKTFLSLLPVLRIRIRRIHMFLGLLDPDPDPSIIKQK